jgi:hypothetical protein
VGLLEKHGEKKGTYYTLKLFRDIGSGKTYYYNIKLGGVGSSDGLEQKHLCNILINGDFRINLHLKG